MSKNYTQEQIKEFENQDCHRTPIKCPNCFKKFILQGGGDVWCDECGTHFARTSPMSVRYVVK